MNHYPIQDREISSDILQIYREKAQKREREVLHPRASLSENHSRYHGREDDHRLPYKRDVDRIIHSKAYSRYIDKTQVVYLVENDHVTHRSLHVQLVSSFARGIAEILQLNLDLVEAIALGHDVGHPPFGHEGEMYLSAISEEWGEGVFAHPWQSCRLFSEIEPLNLGLAVCDGFLCHDGGMQATRLEPRFGKSWEDHFEDMKAKVADPEANIMPGTLEGCLVKLCDTMSYLGRDIEDAISLGIIKREQVPHTILGKANREILQALACDVIRHSHGKEYIALSQDAFDALMQLRKFNFEHIYLHPKLKVESKKVKTSYKILCETLLEDLLRQGKDSHVYRDFLKNKTRAYLDKSSPKRMVLDYVSGMTDSFFVRTLEKLIVPKQIELL